MAKRRQGPTPKRKPWQPLKRALPEDSGAWAKHGFTPPDATYVNDLYSVYVRQIGRGALHISFHRHDRAAVKDFRHYQAIKNEIAGPERLALEVFPPESMLVDTANEMHMFVVPPGMEHDFPFLLARDRLVMTQQEGEEMMGKTKARQRPWQSGIPTGKGTET